MSMPYVEFKDVAKIFPTKHGPFIAVENVNLDVAEGEFISIMGHSGCGKSTLLNTVAGLSTASKGTVKLEGELITKPGPERMVVFQNYSLLPWMTVYKNVYLAVRNCRKDLSGSEHKETTDHFINMVGLSHARDRFPRELSGGMKQRASIARALAVNPKVLLLDEPFGALDALTREELQDELLEIVEENHSTVLMITHDVDEAIILSDRIVMMSNGPAANIGAIYDVPLTRPRDREALMEDPAFYTLRNKVLGFLYGHEDDIFGSGDIDNTLSAADAYTEKHDHVFEEADT